MFDPSSEGAIKNGLIFFIASSFWDWPALEQIDNFDKFLTETETLLLLAETELDFLRENALAHCSPLTFSSSSSSWYCPINSVSTHKSWAFNLFIFRFEKGMLSSIRILHITRLLFSSSYLISSSFTSRIILARISILSLTESVFSTFSLETTYSWRRLSL